MDRSWIRSKARNKSEYINGVTNFIKFATDYMKPGTNKILCPCLKCNNYRSKSIDAVEEQLFAFGIVSSYIRWTINRWSNKSFTMLLELLKEAFLEGETLPTKPNPNQKKRKCPANYLNWTKKSIFF
ncbi:hypothetical protein ACOSP7_019179 [Xanthoceras sorbifolium]